MTILTAHSRIEIGRALLATGHWHGIRHGVKLDMRLEQNLIGRMIICTIGTGKKKQQVTAATVFEIGNTLQSKIGRMIV